LRTSCANAHSSHAEGPTTICPLPRNTHISEWQHPVSKVTKLTKPTIGRRSPSCLRAFVVHPNPSPKGHPQTTCPLRRNLSPSGIYACFDQKRVLFRENARASTRMLRERRIYSPAPSPQSPAPHTSIVPQPPVVYDVGFPRSQFGWSCRPAALVGMVYSPGTVGSSVSSALPQQPLTPFSWLIAT
jgi:hypothetical protein